MPHDAKQHDQTSGRTRKGIALELGYDVVIAPQTSIRDGIEAVRTMLPLTWFNSGIGDGIEYLKAYRAEYDEKNGVFRLQPVHDFTSHAADAVRYFAVSRHLLGFGSSAPIEYDFTGTI